MGYSSNKQLRRLDQAAEQHENLTQLWQKAEESAARFRAIRPLLPPVLQTLIRPGIFQNQTWCLLVDSGAAATKLKQLTPAILAHLRTSGLPTEELRIKIAAAFT